jgi:uncharacterized membrane protein (DUF2068 family)
MDRQALTRAGLVVYGVIQLVQGLWMVVDPGSFFDAVGPFGVRNDHYTRDMATWSLAIGPVCLWAARRDHRTRAAVLLIAGLEAAIHTVNHIVDAGDADPHWVGIFDAVSLAAFAVALLVLSSFATKEATA